jgi:hypothetical protein
LDEFLDGCSGCVPGTVVGRGKHSLGRQFVAGVELAGVDRVPQCSGDRARFGVVAVGSLIRHDSNSSELVQATLLRNWLKPVYGLYHWLKPVGRMAAEMTEEKKRWRRSL